jgi:catechol 2,3-dioxygenase-like lactoylglutathione lyase family enzyme
MKARGIGLLAMDGSPLPPDGGRIAQGVRTGDALDDRGIRIAYWPTSLTRGSAVEMYEYRGAVETDVFTIRNRSWQGVTHGPEVPRIDRIAIIVADVHKTAAFYREVLGLRRHTPVFTLPGEGNAQSGGMKVQFIDARGVVLALVQPDGPGPLADYLARNGDGFLAEIIAEVVSWSSTNDAFHIAAPREDCVGIDRMFRTVLRKSDLAPSDVGYINPHGTGTQANDRLETATIKAVFGAHAATIPVSSTKSMTGHQMGAAGAFEVAVSALALRDRVVPPTINLETPDPACDLDYVAEGARAMPALDVAISCSIGLGGHNGAVALRRI